ncbi:MAG: FimV/HubP family polar landmark protein [Halioglobus sp.]
MATKNKLAAALFSLGCMHAGSVWALGLGDITLESFLNEPLKAQVDLLNTDGLHSDEIRIRLATSDDFERLGVDRAYFLTGIKFDVTVDASGRGMIVVTSEEPVLEPYLDFIIEARWPSGRLLREYTVLIDPPVFDESTQVISASERVAEVEGVPAPTPKKQGAAATSGTRVDVKQSDLAPGEMPQRDFSSGTSGVPTPGARYMIRRDETLWNIALAGKPEGVSVHQAMLDIQRMNPNAFIDGNINRIKAGYIVYMPDTGDISSDNLAQALAEVNQQNEDWRAGRASEPSYGGGPSLRISADAGDDTGDADAAQGTTQSAAADRGGSMSSSGAAEESDLTARANAELSADMAQLSEQVETLERIVSVKDEQIAALQAALEEARTAPAEAMMGGGSGPGDVDDASDGMVADSIVEVEPAEERVTQPVQPQVQQPQPKPTPVAPPPEEGGLMSYLPYLVGLILAALAGLFFWRRKNANDDSEDATPRAAASDDAFAGVQLQSTALEVEAPQEVESAAPVEALVESAPEEENDSLEELLGAEGDRGYGQEKHDDYSSDEEAGDALAEADIYVAYGRLPQAVDLLNGAVKSDPDNASYRLKLIELGQELGDAELVAEHYGQLQRINDPDALAGARVLMDAATPAQGAAPATTDLELSPEEPLEDTFSGLEIEGADSDDLDLSSDFAEVMNDAPDEEDLVFATEGNPMSTKLDLARAYLDMGDEDGAKLILDEVIAEGNDEQQQEARALIERIG